MDWILRLATLALILYCLRPPKYEMVMYCIKTYPDNEWGVGYFKDGVLIRCPEEEA